MDARREHFRRRQQIEPVEHGLVLLLFQKLLDCREVARGERQWRPAEHGVASGQIVCLRRLLDESGELALHE
jgi:hypothetical protein